MVLIVAAILDLRVHSVKWIAMNASISIVLDEGHVSMV